METCLPCSLWRWLLLAGPAQESRKVKVKSLPGMESSAIILWLRQVSWSLFPFQKGRTTPPVFGSLSETHVVGYLSEPKNFIVILAEMLDPSGWLAVVKVGCSGMGSGEAD